MAVGLALALASCGGADERGAEDEVTVYAAASLTEVFRTLDPGARYDFAGSDELATRIREGAPADVYAAASSKYPQELYRDGLVERPVAFASNRLVAIVPKDNAAGIETVEDVARPGTKLVVAAAGVPVGDYTREVLGELHLRRALRNVVSNEDDVKGVLGKVSLGEADAGFVYATDATAAGARVVVVELPTGSQPAIEYQLAVVANSAHKESAEAFVRRVLGPDGRKALAAAGFLLPPA